MPDQAVERKLVAILAADIAGYSRLVGLDEEGTLARLRALRRELIDPTIAEHRGRIVKTTGDGMLAEFASVVDAVRYAVAVQRATATHEAAQVPERRIEFRVGINVGDIVVEGDDIMGDGVNIAARLEGISEPGGICLSAAAYEQARDKLEVAFSDKGEQQLKNIARPVRVYRVELDKPGLAQPAVLPLPDKPSIAVLPFQNMSGDPEQEYFVEGMVEEIITALSRIRWLFVIARNSSFTYKGRAIDIKQVGRELGVRYVLEGSVRKGSGLVRITAQLIEAETGSHLWADRFDGSLEDVFELQDRIAVSVAGVVEPALETAEIRHSMLRPTEDLTAYDLYIRAIPKIGAHGRREMMEALGLLERAIERDPNYALALSLGALCRAELHVAGWISDAEVNRNIGLELARRALGSAGDDPAVLNRAAYALGCFDEDITTAIALMDKSLLLNPSFAYGWVNSGWIRLYAGEHDVAIEHFLTGVRLNPRNPGAGASLGIGIGHFFARRFAEAEVALLRSLQLFPGWVGPYRWLASCYAHMARFDEARAMVRRLRGTNSDVGQIPTRYRNPEQRELFLSGLRLAVEPIVSERSGSDVSASPHEA